MPSVDDGEGGKDSVSVAALFASTHTKPASSASRLISGTSASVPDFVRAFVAWESHNKRKTN